jgi:hypothetical protein
MHWSVYRPLRRLWRHAERLRNNVSGVRALWPRAHQHTHNLITLGSNNAAAALSLPRSQTMLLHGPLGG